MSGYPCPICGAGGFTENCLTPTGRDHAARWQLQNDVGPMRNLIANRDVGFRLVGARTRLHVWLSDSEKRPLTVRERRALEALATAREIEPVYAVGNNSRGAYEIRRAPVAVVSAKPAAFATVVPVAPQKRGTVSEADRAAIAAALEARNAAERAVRDAVLTAVSNGASVRELDALDGLSAATVSRWKRESSSP